MLVLLNHGGYCKGYSDEAISSPLIQIATSAFGGLAMTLTTKIE